MQQENLRPQINIEDNDKKTDERYQKNIIDHKEYDKRDQISKKRRRKKNWGYKNHETARFEFTRKIYILRNNLMK